jgi:tetratricopeptide (TPR) repeat protein
MIIKLFLASPGDTKKERKYVHDVVAELNRTIAHPADATLKVVAWEQDAYPGYGADPQELINRQIADMSACELFVGLMWNRIGTPTPRATSGTIEEYERAVQAHETTGRPDIWFYFRECASQLNTKDQLAQRHSVLDFRATLGNALTSKYTTPPTFRSLFNEHLTRWINARLKSKGPQKTLISQSTKRRTARHWSPKEVMPLQPAPFFAGRAQELAELSAWLTSTDSATAVASLTAVGGTGKTALAAKILNSLRDVTDFGVFVWSFYENPQTEAFLRAACKYFCGSLPKHSSEIFERLQDGLSGTLPHILFLDGLELIQATGTTGRPRGELEDPIIRRFLRWLAARTGTAARALITTRFPLLDLVDWSGAGFTNYDLDDLDALAARAIFHKWGVKGDDATIDALSARVHRHALTIDVLGSYLGTYHGGDPAKAPSFDPEFLADTDAKTAKLYRVLTSYAAKLLPTEKDLIIRLSLFPRGVNAEILRYLVDAGDNVAGSLSKCTGDELTKLLERLRSLGLVFKYAQRGRTTFSAHPFLRGFFEKLLSVDSSRMVHETVRVQLVGSLSDESTYFPDQSDELDRFERLIEITRLAGHDDDAYDLFDRALGAYENLGSNLGEYSRGLRIVSGFSRDGTVQGIDPTLAPEYRLQLIEWWTLFAIHLGDLETARRVIAYATSESKFVSYTRLLLRLQNTLALLEMNAGRWVVARRVAQATIKRAAAAIEEQIHGDAHCIYASCAFAMGDLRRARRHFRASKKDSFDPKFVGMDSILEAECRIRLGRTSDDYAERLAAQNSMYANHSFWNRSVAIWESLKGIIACREGSPYKARHHLASARAFSTASGDTEVALRCYELDAVIARAEGKLPEAIRAAENGLQLADSSGFGRWRIDIRLELAATWIVVGEMQKAYDLAVEAERQSQNPESDYVWGIAQAAYLAGVSKSNEQNASQARDLLKRARELSIRYGLPKVEMIDEAIAGLK